jgi:hypothetical protein
LVQFPLDVEVTGLAWDDLTDRLYFIGLDDGGMFLGAVGNGGAAGSADSLQNAGYERLTPARHITVSDLRAGGGRLYFGSIVSGKDEAHVYDIATGTEYRLTTSRFGAFQPAPGGEKAAVTVYDKDGYHLAVQDFAAAQVQQQRDLPIDLVNPKWKRWELPKMDSLVYDPAKIAQTKTPETAAEKPKRYRKGLTLFRPHSWLPLNFYPPAAINEQNLTMSLGATVMSQNLLSDATSWLAYGWSRRGSHLLRGGMTYSGLGPTLSVEFNYGGASQVLYGPMQMFQARYPYVPAGLDVTLKRHFDVSTAILLPMTVSSGYWLGTLTPAVGFSYNNGLIFRPNDDGVTANLTRGVERLTFSASYSGQTRMTHKDFLPRWGFVARASYVINPTDRTFRDLWSVSLNGYLPGIVRPHSTRIRVGWQQTAGSGDLMFHQKELFPRGALYNFATRRWAFASVDYQLPVWYPEGGISRVLYFKRVRVNLFADYARWQDFSGTSGGSGSGGRRFFADIRTAFDNEGVWRPLFTYGGDIILDVSPLRMPATTTMSLKFTIAKPSDRRGIFFNFGLDIPL